MAGKLNKNISANSITAGLENTSRGDHSLTVGTNNDVQNTSSVTAGIRNIITVGNRNITAGCNNKFNFITDSLVVGNNNTKLESDDVDATGIVVAGSGNEINPTADAACDYILVGGENHTITDAKRSIVAGNQNTIEGWNSLSVGMTNNVQHSNTIVGGFSNKTSRQNQAVFGEYNYSNSSALLIVGKGTSNNDRKNAFEVLADGRAQVLTAPSGETDVVRKKELDAVQSAAKSHTDEAIKALDATVTGTAAGKTIAKLSETDGKIAATFQDISITKSQISDFDDNDYDAKGAASSVLGSSNDTKDNVTVYGVKAYASGRLSALESKLNTVSNVMDFVGAKESLPTSGDYQSGDVIVVTKGRDAGKEFVYDGEKWVEFGYSDSLNTAIAGLQDGKVDKVDGKDLITTSEITRLAGVSDGANKVEPSKINGHIKIDGTDTTVYDDKYCVKLSDVTGVTANDEILTNIADALVRFMPWYEGEVETT